MIPLIDTHLHLWDRSLHRRPWLSGSLDRDFSMVDYRAAMEDIPVEAVVYVETGVVPEDRVSEAQWILDLINQDRQLVGAVLSGDPMAMGFSAYLDALVANPGSRGIRLAWEQSADATTALPPALIQSVRRLGEAGLCCDLNLDADDLASAVVLAEACPETTFVLDHCGNPGPQQERWARWRDAITLCAGSPNLYCKVSGLASAAPSGKVDAETLGPLVEHCIGAFGYDRVLFGTDWPVCTLYTSPATWVRVLSEIVSGASEIERRQLFRDNAIRVYGLLLV